MRGFVIILTSIIFLMVALFTLVGFINKGANATRGVRVANLDIGDLSKEDAAQILEERVEEYKNSTFFIQTDGGEQIEVSPKSMGSIFDIDGTLNKAYGWGQNKNFVQNLFLKTSALLFKKHFPINIQFDNAILVHFITNTLSPIHYPAKNGTFVYNFDTKEFNFSDAKTGRVININDLLTKIEQNVSSLSEETVHVEQSGDLPLVYNEGADSAREHAEKIIASSDPYVIEGKKDSWEIENEDLITWIEFKPQLNKETNKYELAVKLSRIQIQNYLTSFAPGLNSAPTNAEFKMENGRVVAFSLAAPGYELSIAASAEKIASAVENMETKVALEFIETPPPITQESIDNLGITALLARGESNFAGSPSSRRHNIKVGSDKFQGLLIAPNEVFSFNTNLGPVNATTGYLPELVIKQNQTVPEYGGGLCQVSTTLFRAAIYAGLEITKRSNHSYPVIYYGTPGFDATIYPPNPDLAFRNNTPGHILIQHKIEGSNLIFELYGEDDGRQTEVVGPITYDRKSDGSVKATLQQIVKDGGGDVLFEKTFYSNYRSPLLYPVNRNPLE